MNKCCKYAHYYLRSAYRYTWDSGDFVEDTLEAILYDGMLIGSDQSLNKTGTSNDGFEICDFRKGGNFQLMLRHPCDMTKKQTKMYKEFCYKVVDLNNDKRIVRYADTPQSMDFLFRNSIDAFDLIDDGHAIDLKLK